MTKIWTPFPPCSHLFDYGIGLWYYGQFLGTSFPVTIITPVAIVMLIV